MYIYEIYIVYIHTYIIAIYECKIIIIKHTNESYLQQS